MSEELSEMAPSTLRELLPGSHGRRGVVIALHQEVWWDGLEGRSGGTVWRDGLVGRQVETE